MAELLIEGACVDGRYVLQQPLGEGTFGGVWRARDEKLGGRLVAVKFLKEEFLEQPSTVKRFEAEGDALAKISHPNVVAVIDRGQWQRRRYLVTEFVDGRPLSQWIDLHRVEATPPDLSECLALFDQLCAGVEAAHSVRDPGPLVHRDLKPENVLLGETGESAAVKIVDFGIAQLGGRNGTRTGAMMGTPLYMAPEQAMGNTAAIGPWTDVFALGVILTELLTLRAQVEEGEPWWGTALHRGGSVRALLSAIGPEVPGAVWDVVAVCLAAQGRERFQHAGALRVALRDAALECLPGGVSSAPRASSASRVSERVERVATPSRSSTLPSDPSGAPGPSAAEPAASEPPGPQGSSVEEPPPVPWARLVVGVISSAVLLSVVIVAAVVRADRHRAETLGRADGPAPGPAATRAPRPVATERALESFLRAWSASVAAPRTEPDLSGFYAPRVSWNGSATVDDARGIARSAQANALAGGHLRVDLAQSTVSEEDPQAPAVASPCRRGTGALLKVRARADERRPDRDAAIGCADLRGVYLLRLRRFGGGLRICHETWSLDEGVCASCPTATVCARRR